MSYRIAESLNTLRGEVNEAAPKRSTASDGLIGDTAHASRSSDHNPWLKDAKGIGVVRAFDITHDPANGCDAERIAANVVKLMDKGHPALKSGSYVIWNRRILSFDRRAEGWRTYTGSNPHDKHVHISVGTAGYDSLQPWRVAGPDPRLVRAQKAVQARLRALRAARRRLAALRERLK